MSAMQRTALVTGGSRRLGAAICRGLHEAGYALLVHYHCSRRQAQALVAELNRIRAGSALAVQADLRDAPQRELLLERTLAFQGRLDVLINNASVYRPTPLDQVQEQDWEEFCALHLRAPLHLAQGLAPALRRSRGCIINLTDLYAIRPQPRHALYCATKAGLEMLTRSLALELAPRVRVNALAPGVILWPAKRDAAQKAVIRQSIPLGRSGTAQEVAQAVLYLVGARYQTGQTLILDGGRATPA